MHSNGKNRSGMNSNDLPGLKYSLGVHPTILWEGCVVINLLVLEKQVSHYTFTMLLGDTNPYWDQS